VEQHRQAQIPCLLQSASELVVIQPSKALHARDKVGLETHHAIRKLGDVAAATLLERLGRDATVQTKVNDRFLLDNLPFSQEIALVGNRWHRRTRHVDDRRDSSRGRRTAPVIKVFSMRVPGIVKVDMWIDSTRQDDKPSGIEFGTSSRQSRADFGDPPLIDPDIYAAQLEQAKAHLLMAKMQRQEKHLPTVPQSLPAH